MKSDKTKQAELATKQTTKPAANKPQTTQETNAQFMARMFGKQELSDSQISELWQPSKELHSKAHQCLVTYAVMCILAKIAEFAMSPNFAASHAANLVYRYAVRLNGSGDMLSELRNTSGKVVYFPDCHSTLAGTAQPFKLSASDVYSMVARQVTSDQYNAIKKAFIASVKTSGAIADKIKTTLTTVGKVEHKAVIDKAGKLAA